MLVAVNLNFCLFCLWRPEHRCWKAFVWPKRHYQLAFCASTPTVAHMNDKHKRLFKDNWQGWQIIFQNLSDNNSLWGHVAIMEPFPLLLSVLHHISLRCISVSHTVCLRCYSPFNSDPLLPAIQSLTFPGLKVITTLICCPLLCLSVSDWSAGNMRGSLYA